jgi:hypothetical protein
MTMASTATMPRFGIFGRHETDDECRHNGGDPQLHASTHFALLPKD